MRFRLSSRPPTYFDHRLQWRLLGGVAFVGAVMFAWQAYRVAQNRPAGAPIATPPASINYTVETEPNAPLKADEFRVRRNAPASTVAQHPADVALDPALLDTVRDNTLGIRHEEADAFYRVLNHVRDVPAAELQQSAVRDVLYVNLMTEPDKYRGRVISIVGDMWRCYALPKSKDRPGERLYEAWVFTADSGTHPYRVVASQLGPQMKLGENLRTPVRVTGYFFKREGYDTPGGLHVAPTILAKSIAAYVSPNAPPPADDLTPILLSVMAGLGLILAATFLSFAWGDRRASRPAVAAHRLTTLDPQALPETDERSVEEQLRELSERDRFGESWSTPSHHGNGRASSS